MLQSAYSAGVRNALSKFALAAPSPADAFSAAVEEGKDMPPPQAGALALPQEPAAALGDPNGALPTKDAALGLKDMLFFEKMLGPDEARSMFQSIEKSMSGQTRGVPHTLNITPQGVQRLPHPGAAPAAPPVSLGQQAAQVAGSKTPPPIPAAAMKPRMPR